MIMKTECASGHLMLFSDRYANDLCTCCLRIKPFLLCAYIPDDISTPRVRADSSSSRDTHHVVIDCETEQTKQSQFIRVEQVREHNKTSQAMKNKRETKKTRKQENK